MIFNIFNVFFTVRKKRTFRFFLTIFLLPLFSSIAALANADHPANARKQIFISVQQQAMELIRQEAKRRQWTDYQAKMNLFIPDEVSQYEVCPQPLAVSMPNGDLPDLHRLRFDVRCKSPYGWYVAVIVKPDIYLPVIVASTPLERGQVIDADSIAIKKMNISSTRGDYQTQPDKIIGMAVKRRIRDRQPISLSQLESPLLVERGQRVLMIAGQNGVEARTVGEAMKKGRKGEIIKVKNESSGRVVSAVVADVGVVNMVYAREP